MIVAFSVFLLKNSFGYDLHLSPFRRSVNIDRDNTCGCSVFLNSDNISSNVIHLYSSYTL